MPSKLLPISKEEEKWLKKLSPKRSLIYHFSRGCLRHAMSSMTGLGPLDIPLKADPGKPPLLAKGWGHVSMSHCTDALLIGWYSGKIGVDIERKDRELQARKLSKRFFSKHEDCEIDNLRESQAQNLVIRRWVVKEAAIKWQSGKIATNINQWIWKNNSPFAYHQKLGYRVKVYEKSYSKWTFAIALDDSSVNHSPIICLN